MAKRLIFFIVFSTLFLVSFSQRRNKYKYEILGGIGPTGFLGDLGGANQTGTHFVKDYDFNSSRYCINAGVRYKYSNTTPFAFKAMLSAGMVSGNDALTQEPFRQNRNLNFRSPIIELAIEAEYYFIGEKTKNVYSISGLRSKKKRYRKFTAYLMGGIGIFYYNPQERLFNDQWYNVRKYHVEGQGMPGGPKQFSNFSFSIPLGIGCRYALTKRWSIGAEYGIRKTFTDYIDGVSGNYYDKTALQATYGPTAVALADPSLGTIPNATSPNADGTGAKRGDPKYKDSYMFLTVNVGYKFTKKHRTRAKF